MHASLAALAIAMFGAACSDKLPAAPDLARFKALPSTARCEASEPRAIRCVDDLLLAQVRQLEIGELGAALEKDIRGEPTSSEKASTMHRVHCAEDDAYPEAVVACWAVPDCRAFADCVYSKLARVRR